MDGQVRSRLIHPNQNAEESLGMKVPLDRRRLVLVVILALAAISRLVFLCAPLGFLSGDDVEILMTGMDAVSDLGYHPWEIRNLLLPLSLVTPVVGAARSVGITSPTALVRIAELPFLFFSVLNVWLVYRLARRFEDPKGGSMPLVAAGIYSFHWLPLAYGATVYPRPVATTALLLATLVLGRARPGLAAGAIAGGLIALAFSFRYSEALFLLPLAASVVWKADNDHEVLPALMGIGLGFAMGGGLTVGLVDWVTWGKPFESLFEFARYTLVDRSSSSLVESQSWYWYLKRANFWLLPPLIPFFFVRLRRFQAVLWVFVAVPILVLSFIHHKEIRYLQGVVPFLAILWAIGATRWWEKRKTSWRVWTVGLGILALAFSVRTATKIHTHGSQAAVAVARELARDPSVRRVVVTQAWAYGSRMILGADVEVVDFDQAPTPEQLRDQLGGTDAVALYLDDLAGQPGLGEVLGAAGFRRTQEVRASESRPVAIYRLVARQGSS